MRSDWTELWEWPRVFDVCFHSCIVGLEIEQLQPPADFRPCSAEGCMDQGLSRVGDSFTGRDGCHCSRRAEMPLPKEQASRALSASFLCVKGEGRLTGPHHLASHWVGLDPPLSGNIRPESQASMGQAVPSTRAQRQILAAFQQSARRSHGPG